MVGLTFTVVLLVLLHTAGLFALAQPQPQPGDHQEGGLSKECPAGQTAVQAKSPVSNGCSKPAGISIQGEEDFTFCCDRHDACYETCHMPKAECEQDFRRCMMNLCKTVYSHNPFCSQAANAYMLGTTMFGGGGFKESQEKHCQCQDVATVPQHYHKLIHNFYVEHVPEKADQWASFETGKIQGYLAADGASLDIKKLAKLYYTLHKKYDSAIRHIGARKGKVAKAPPLSKSEL